MSLHCEIIPVTLFRQNATLIWDEDTKDAILTDVGGDVSRILETIEEFKVRPQAIWLTHGHLDHAGGVADLKKHFDIPVYGPHRDDAFLLETLPESTAEFGFPHSPALTPDHWLNEGKTLKVGNFTFSVLHIPGHTPGHVVFYCEQAGLLITGDTLFFETVGRTDFPLSSHKDLIHHIRTKLLTLPEDTTVVPGHGRPTTIGHEKRNNPYLVD